MTGERDVAGFVEHTRVRLAIDWSDVFEKYVDNDGSVQDDFDVIFDANDGLLIPLVEWLQVTGRCWHNAVD